MVRFARSLAALALLVLYVGAIRPAEVAAPPPGDKTPVLRVEPEGATSHVTALAFSADGKTLYAAGWDKVIRVWTLNDKGRFVPARVHTYRVPIGPGMNGAINAMALSQDDGLWLAAAGVGVFRGAAGFSHVGLVRKSGELTDEMFEDIGTITLFNTRVGSVRLLRGHRGYVDGLAFAPPAKGKPAILLSTAFEPIRGTRPTRYKWSARLWDVARGESREVLSELPEVPAAPPLPRPGLAVWHTTTGVRAALSFSDSFFRVWKEGRASPRQEEDLPYASSVVRLPGLNSEDVRLITAGRGEGRAQLTWWSIDRDGNPRGTPPDSSATKSGARFPKALGLISREANGKADLAATILGPANGGASGYRLQFVSIAPEDLGTVQRETFLWDGQIGPVLATSLRSRFLAVGGAPDHAIHVYPIAPLLAGEKVKPQKLGSLGRTFQHVSFVRKGKGKDAELGLLLNDALRRGRGQTGPNPDAEKSDVIFAINDRRVTSRLEGWRKAAPAANGWRARYSADTRSIVIDKDAKRIGQVSLPAGNTLSDFALLPPDPAGKRKTPLLALATTQGGQPRLVLYNAETGAEIRHFTGHLDHVTALAFSDDGRLLASTAQDQTVCVWSLTTLNQITERNFGHLPEVSVREKDDGLIIGHTSDKLRAGEPFLGLVEGGKLQPLKSYLKYHESIHAKKPGSMVTLRVGKPGAERDVALTVSQGSDMRNPLFSVFVLTGHAAGDPDWIGWHPMGPFDASSARAEGHLGWHFNTGDAKLPARFALAREHRKAFYTEGLLKTLVKQGRLYIDGKPVGKAEVLNPRIAVIVMEGDRPIDPEGTDVVVGKPEVAFHVAIKDCPLDKLKEATYKVDGLPEAKLKLDRPSDRFVLPKLERGKPRVVEITAWTKEKVSRVVRQQFTVSYEPVAPKIHFEGSKNNNAKDASFRLVAKVLPSRAGEKVVFTIRRNGKIIEEETRERQIAPGDTWNVDLRLKLKDGKNVIVLEAVNKGALPSKPDKSTRPVELEIYLAKKAAPPVIVLMVPDPGGKAKWKEVSSSETVYVSASEVFVSGKINADENLRAAEWQQVGPESNPVAALSDFKPDKSLTFKEKLKLKPGLQTYRFQAKSVSSPQSDRELKIFYRPTLPGVTNVRITGLNPGNVLYGEKETAVVTITGRITIPKDKHPYSAMVVVDDEEQGKLDVDERAGTFKAQATIKPGSHTVRIKLSNKWTTHPVLVAAARMEYLRPPRFLALQKKDAPGKHVLDFDARVRSPLPLLPESVEVKVNGAVYPLAKLPVIKPAARAGEYSFELKEVPLDAERKDNLVQVWVNNAEAKSRAPGEERVDLVRLLAPPKIGLLSVRDERVTVPQVRVSFQVSSKTPITQVELVRDGSEGREGVPINLADVRRDTAGVYHLRTELDVRLEAGLNYLNVEVVNHAGRAKGPTRAISYVPLPVSVVVDRMEVIKPGGKTRTVKYRPTEKNPFEKVEEGKVLLHGRIVWNSEEAAGKHEHPEVRVFVNGFQQIPAKTLEAGDNKLERRFESYLLLNRDTGNQVQLVALGGLAASTEFRVDCRAPVKKQRLHLLLLNPHATDEDQVKEEVWRAIKTVRGAFDAIEPEHILIGPAVTDRRIVGRLDGIKERIKDLQRDPSIEPMNDVVMIYYQGRETIKEKGNFFRIPGLGKDTKGADIPCDDVVSELANTSGAHVFLLDVERDAPVGKSTDTIDKIAEWDRYYPREVQSHIVVMRHAWIGKAACPDKDRLISVLREALPKAAILRELEVQMGKIREGRPPSRELLATGFVPAELKDTRIGR